MKLSCVIPTKNRAPFVKELLCSLRDQLLDGVEVVVIDNDDGKETEQCVRSFGSLVRYVRTGGLPMIENWNRALSESQGDYTLLIEDKMHVRPGALKAIVRELERTQAPLLTWRASSGGRAGSNNGTFSEKSISVSSFEIIRNALLGGWKTFNRQAPKGLNCAISTQLILDVKRALNRPVCRAVCPDYTLAFTLLQQCSEVRHFDAVLYGFEVSAPSQGKDMLVKKDAPSDVARKLGCSEQQFWSMVPVKYLSVNNIIYNDMFNCLSEFGNFREEAVCWNSYYLELIDELGLMNLSGGNVSQECSLLREALGKRGVLFKAQLMKRAIHDFSWQVRMPSMKGAAVNKLKFRLKFTL